jgi:hypothetical protein
MRGHLRIELRSAAGETLDLREVDNAVMQAGAELVARLFAGQGTPITHMGVGTSNEPETEEYTTAALTNAAVGEDPPLQEPIEVVLPPESFTISIDELRHVVRVRVRGTLPAAAAVGTVREAGLLSRSGDTARLYNRVTFAPILKGDDHELTMFWEVSFPYGDLQWLM